MNLAALKSLYATHFVWPGKGLPHPPATKETVV